jgi:hypothetical protein
MRQFLLRTVLVSIMVVLFGCGTQPQPTISETTQIPAEAGMGLMRGQLLDQNNQPLANRSVRLAAVYGEGEQQAYVADESGGVGGVTDAAGAFAIANIPPGKYVVLLVLREGISLALMQKNGTERIIEIRPDVLFDLGPAAITIPQ